MPRNQQSASNTDAQLSVRCDEDLKAAYKDALDAQGTSMSDDLREHMEAVVRANSDRPGPQEHRPTDSTLRAVYDSLLTYSNETLRLTLEFYDSAIANDSGVKKGSLPALCYRLQSKNYVRISGDPPGVSESKTYLKVKPPCAVPDEWVHRRRPLSDRRSSLSSGGAPADD